MKKLLFFLSFLSLSLTVMAYDFTADGVFYNITDSAAKTVELTFKDTKYNTYSGTVVIPTSVSHGSSTYSVTSIGNNAFYQSTALNQVIIPTSIAEIGYGSFAYSGITSVDIPSSVTTLSDAFSFCTSLESVKLPSSITYIEDGIFYSCTALTSIVIPNSVTAIGPFAFYNNSSLSSVVIGDSVKYLEEDTFSDCISLKTINIPAALHNVMQSFVNCTSLETVNVDENNQYITSVDGIVFSKDMSSLQLYPAGRKARTYFVPDETTVIGTESFSGASYLETLVIHENVTNLNNYVFRDCSNLREIYMKSITPIPTDGRDNFTGVPLSSCILYIPEGTKSAYETEYGIIPYVKPVGFENIVELDYNSSKEVISTSGNLSSLLSSSDKIGLAHLIITGEIDIRDIFFIRDSLYNLQSLELSNVQITGYTGVLDTLLFRTASTYAANTLPVCSFKDKKKLKNVSLPSSLIEIKDRAFSGCITLDTIRVNTTQDKLIVANSSFEGVDKLNCELIVPTGTEASYRSSVVWQDFFNVTASSADFKSQLNFQAVIQADELYLSGLQIGSRIQVYNISGIEIFSGFAKSNDFILSLPFHGIYVIVVNEYRLKMLY